MYLPCDLTRFDLVFKLHNAVVQFDILYIEMNGLNLWNVEVLMIFSMLLLWKHL